MKQIREPFNLERYNYLCNTASPRIRYAYVYIAQFADGTEAEVEILCSDANLESGKKVIALTKESIQRVLYFTISEVSIQEGQEKCYINMFKCTDESGNKLWICKNIYERGDFTYCGCGKGIVLDSTPYETQYMCLVGYNQSCDGKPWRSDAPERLLNDDEIAEVYQALFKYDKTYDEEKKLVVLSDNMPPKFYQNAPVKVLDTYEKINNYYKQLNQNNNAIQKELHEAFNFMKEQ